MDILIAETASRIKPLIDSASLSLKKSAHDQINVAILFEKGRIPVSQIYPFEFYKNDFKKLGIKFKKYNIDEFEASDKFSIGHPDFIIFQPWFDKGDSRMVQMLNRLKEAHPKAKILFFDCYAPTDLRFAESVDPFIDYYVKKHVFRDRSQYNKATAGDTSLVEYYNRLYNLSEEPLTLFKVPDSFLKKLIVGPTFFTSEPMMLPMSSSKRPFSLKKSINVHARLTTKGTPWYSAMRQSAIKSCHAADSIITDEFTGLKKYARELRSSRICFSPFGYGEICWRDYEAIFSGALLIKPDSSHVETYPDVFKDKKTYVACKWDFSDLDEKIDYYLSHEDERLDIVNNAYKLLHRYINGTEFIELFAGLFGRTVKK